MYSSPKVNCSPRHRKERIDFDVKLYVQDILVRKKNDSRMPVSTDLIVDHALKSLLGFENLSVFWTSKFERFAHDRGGKKTKND